MGIVRDSAHHVQMVVKVPVKGAKEVVKMDVRVGVQVVVHNLVVVDAAVVAKEVVWNIVPVIVWEDVKQDVCTIVETTA